jgi:hypothetical protein
MDETTARRIAELEQEKAHLVGSLRDMWVLMQQALGEAKEARAETAAVRRRYEGAVLALVKEAA